MRRAGPNYEGYFIQLVREDIYISAAITRVDPNIVLSDFMIKILKGQFPKKLLTICSMI